MTTTAAPPKLTPELQAVFEIIGHINTHKKAPDEALARETGRYKENVQALIEAFTLDGFDVYQNELGRFFRENPTAQILFATYTPGAGQQQKTLINFRELRNRPRPQWVIENFIYENTIIELYAEAGCYKSFLAFDWSARIATGTDWLGHRVAKSGIVVYIAAEGADGYISRGDAWCYHNNISFDTLCENFYFWPESLPLSNKAEIARFIEEITETLKESGQTPSLVVIDTLLRCSDGGNINAPDVMGAIFEGANSIKKQLNATNILIVHHAGKNAQLGGMGSVLIKNNCDCIWSMTKDTSVDGQVILKAEKMKDRPEPVVYLRTEKVYYGQFLTEDEASLVIVSGEKPSKKDKQPKMPKSQADLLAILDEHTSLTYSEWLDFYMATGGKKPTFDEAKRALEEKKLVEKVEGKYRRYVAPSQDEEEEGID